MSKPENVPRLDWTTLFKPKNDLSEASRKTLDDYFAAFAQPPFTVDTDGKNNIGNQPCLKCGQPLSGGLSEALFGDGGFEWGIAHGEGHCRNCRWPARAYHFIKDADGKDFMTIRNVILQYHPDFVTIKHRDSSAA